MFDVSFKAWDIFNQRCLFPILKSYNKKGSFQNYFPNKLQSVVVSDSDEFASVNKMRTLVTKNGEICHRYQFSQFKIKKFETDQSTFINEK